MNTNVSELKSVTFAVLNITKIMMNVAFLSIPYAMLKGGFGYMSLLIVLNAFFNCYTAIILGLSAYGDVESNDEKNIPAEDIEQLPSSDTQQDTEDLCTIIYHLSWNRGQSCEFISRCFRMLSSQSAHERALSDRWEADETNGCYTRSRDIESNASTSASTLGR